MTTSRQFTKGQKFFIIIAIFVCGLLFYANAVAFNIIFAPIFISDIITYAALTVAVSLTIITLTMVIRDKRRSFIVELTGAIKVSNEVPETPDTVSSPAIAQTSVDEVESDVAIIETTKVTDETPTLIVHSAKFFGKRNLFVIILAFTVGLLFFANAVAFGLISLPNYYIYAALAGVVAIAAVSVAAILIENIKVLGIRIKRFVSEPQLQDIINEVIEKDQASDIATAPVIAQTSPTKVDSYAELLRQFSVQKTTSKLEAERAEQEKQLPKKPVIPPTKVICPACRKEFNLANYERNYIIDFGRPKPSNLIKLCPHCQTPIPLKRSGVVDDEDVWKD